MMSAPDSPSLIGHRIVVTGMAGAGKSTFSRALARKTGLPLIHLDLYGWDPGWVRVPADEFLARQHVLLAGERWIVDSNDVETELLVARADTLVIMATPWWLCAWRAFRRGLRRPPEIQLPAGCEESLSQRLRDEWGIVWHNWRDRDLVRAEYDALAAHCRTIMQVHILSSKQAMADLLDAL